MASVVMHQTLRKEVTAHGFDLQPFRQVVHILPVLVLHSGVTGHSVVVLSLEDCRCNNSVHHTLPVTGFRAVTCTTA